MFFVLFTEHYNVSGTRSTVTWLWRLCWGTCFGLLWITHFRYLYKMIRTIYTRWVTPLTTASAAAAAASAAVSHIYNVDNLSTKHHTLFAFSTLSLQIICKGVVTLFNYAQVTNFFWMLVEGLYLHFMVVWAFSIEMIKFLWYIVLGWCK